MIDTVEVETNACTVGWNDEIAAVVTEWHGSASESAYMEAMEQLLVVVERREDSSRTRERSATSRRR